MWLGNHWAVFPLLRFYEQEGGQERVSWALVEWEGPGRRPGETLGKSGSLGEGLALRVEVGVPVDRAASECQAAWVTERVAGGEKMKRCVGV